MKKMIMAVAICMIGNPTFAQDCDYVKIVQYQNGKIVNSKTEYVCKGSKPILILPPTKQRVYLTKFVRPPVVSTYDYINFYNR